MKWLVMLLLSFSLSSMDKALDKQSLYELHNHIMLATISDDEDSKNQLKLFINNNIIQAQQEQNSLLTRYRIKGATMALVMSGVAIYGSISSLYKTITEDSDDKLYTNATIALINSGFLFYYSGKELWRTIKNHRAQHNLERALLMKYIYKYRVLKDQEMSAPLKKSDAVEPLTTFNSSSYSLGDKNEI